MPKPDDKTISVSQAAAMLHVSEKTIRRRIKAGELTATKEALDGGGIGWRVQIGGNADSMMDNAMDTRRNRIGQRSGQGDGQTHAQATGATDNAMDVPDNRMDSSVARAGTGMDSVMDNAVDGSAPSFIPFADDKKLSDRDAEEIARQREEIIFLRGLVEQHQRSEAELRASLREALRAMPKQLSQGTPEGATTSSSSPEMPDAPQIGQTANTTTSSSYAVKSSERRTPRPLWKVVLGVR